MLYDVPEFCESKYLVGLFDNPLIEVWDNVLAKTWDNIKDELDKEYSTTNCRRSEY